MKIAGKATVAFLGAPDPAVVAVLLHGPDTGMAREHAGRLAATVLEDPADPFGLIELFSEDIKDDPARLADEMRAMALVGGRRVVRVRDGADAIAATCASVLEDAKQFADGPPLNLIIIEAGELGSRSKLRTCFETAANAAAIACYRESGRDLAAFITETLRAEGIALTREASAYLEANLGIDRAITRAELTKLALYADGRETPLSLEDVVACVGDSSEVTLNDVVLSAASGDLAGTENALDRLFQEGGSPVPALRGLASHLTRLHFCVSGTRVGKTPDTVMAKLRPPVFFKEKRRFQEQTRRWSEGDLVASLRSVREAEAECKTTGAADELLCRRAFLGVSRRARGAVLSG